MHLLLSHFCPFLEVLTSNDFSDSENVFCDSGIELEMLWITRTMLDREDFISHIIDVNDWQITISFFEFLDYTWGHIQWTVFVIFYNKKVNKLYSGLFGNQDVAEWISSSRI